MRAQGAPVNWGGGSGYSATADGRQVGKQVQRCRVSRFFFFKAGSLDFYADGPFIKQYCFDSYEMHGGGEARSPAPRVCVLIRAARIMTTVTVTTMAADMLTGHSPCARLAFVPSVTTVLCSNCHCHSYVNFFFLEDFY